MAETARGDEGAPWTTFSNTSAALADPADTTGAVVRWAARRPAAPVSVGAVTVIKINAITTAADGGDALAERFAARAGSVDGQDGFEGFELLKPTDERTTWLVVTRWRDEAAFKGWVASPAFVAGHQRTAGGGTDGGQKPVGMSSELWSYEIAGGSAG